MMSEITSSWRGVDHLDFGKWRRYHPTIVVLSWKSNAMWKRRDLLHNYSLREESTDHNREVSIVHYAIDDCILINLVYCTLNA